MSSRLGMFGLALTCAALAGCGVLDRGDKARVAQEGGVVATVGDVPITAADLSAETGGASAPDAATQSEINRAALRRIIDRKLLAREAEREKLDDTPDFAARSRRAVELVKADLLAAKLAGAAAQPSAEKIAAYMAQHPEAFAERKLYVVDRILLTQPKEPLKVRAELDSLDQIETVLQSQKIKFRRSQTVVDTASAPPELASRLAQFPPNQLFEVQTGDTVSINEIREVRRSPLVGPAAAEAAAGMVRTKEAQGAVQRKLEALRADARGSITYSSGYEPERGNASP